MSKHASTRMQAAAGAKAARRRSAARPPADERRHRAPAGIGNRMPAEAERRMQSAHPPEAAGSPPPEDAAGRVGEQPLTDRRDRQTSHKAGSRSIAQKESGARYTDRSMPASRKVAGAFGREPQWPVS